MTTIYISDTIGCGSGPDGLIEAELIGRINGFDGDLRCVAMCPLRSEDDGPYLLWIIGSERGTAKSWPRLPIHDSHHVKTFTNRVDALAYANTIRVR